MVYKNLLKIASFLSFTLLFNIALPAHEDILKNPAQTLVRLHKTADKFFDKIKKIEKEKDLNKAFQATHKILEKFHHECPLFLIYECTGRCQLSRLKQPHIRDSYRKSVVQALQTTQNCINNKPIYYASFGSGGRFTDLLNIADFLTLHPHADISIDLIDHEYQTFVGILELLTAQHTITANLNLDVRPHQEKVIKFAQEKLWPTFNKTPINAIASRIQVKVAQTQQAAQQFLGYLQGRFPQATLQLNMHASATDYLEDVAKNNRPHADVFVGADIGQATTVNVQTTRDFYSLCDEILKKNPQAQNILLSKKNDNKNGELVLIAAQGQSGYSPISFINTATGAPADLFIHAQTITN